MNYIFSYPLRLVQRLQSLAEKQLTPYPLFHFNVEQLYPNTISLLKSSFQNLPIDSYHQQHLNEEGEHSTSESTSTMKPPTRLRRFAEFNVEIEGEKHCRLQSNIQSSYEFRQPVNDFRSNTRVFEAIEAHILHRTCIPEYISHMCSVVHSLEAKKRKICPTIFTSSTTVGIHQVRQITYPGLESDNSPEGIHRDGADYIVSALVLNRQNVREGRSIVYAPNKRDILYHHILQQNEMIFQEDRHLWHYVTPVQCEDPRFIGYRDILGLDIRVDSTR